MDLAWTGAVQIYLRCLLGNSHGVYNTTTMTEEVNPKCVQTRHRRQHHDALHVCSGSARSVEWHLFFAQCISWKPSKSTWTRAYSPSVPKRALVATLFAYTYRLPLLTASTAFLRDCHYSIRLLLGHPSVRQRCPPTSIPRFDASAPRDKPRSSRRPGARQDRTVQRTAKAAVPGYVPAFELWSNP